MSGLVLSAEDRGHLLRLMRRQMNSAVRRRLNVLLLDDGRTAERIAAALSLDAGTTRAHRRLHAAAGNRTWLRLSGWRRGAVCG